ncbi:MAG: substrate-binding domain-containing protein [Tannerellaceae bacterium]|jgi:phosphate transport system substrate-binding protein|nr:substrate-binding domain-containing protein [Tannerellaceae bacterium]
MKMRNLRLLTLLLCPIFFACDKEAEDIPFVGLEEVEVENYPIVDGSTSTDPLNKLLVCKLLGFDYRWERAMFMNGLWYLWNNIPAEFVTKHLKSSQTHQAFVNLIDGEAEIILTARKMSPDEKAYAEKAKVSLIETPIALDAFIFIVNVENQIESLTTKQIQDFYTGKITNWKEVGGADSPINPYVRNPNSGSQELMESMIMKELDMPDWDVEWSSEAIPSMDLAFVRIVNNINGLCYTVYYYKEQIVRDELSVRHIAVDGVYPDKNTIKNQSYPYVAEVYAVIRNNLDKSSMAYKLYQYLQTEEGKDIISESGYIPIL